MTARDIQTLEMMPLGPLSGKSFGTSISPWVITLDALTAFAQPSPELEKPVAIHLQDPQSNTYDVTFSVSINSTKVCTTHLNTLYWTFRQMLAHMCVGGCSLRTGDLLASGTLSGKGDAEHGCLLETTWGGAKPLKLSDGSERVFLQDGDVVSMTGLAGGESSGVGFGDCTGVVKPARPLGW